MVTRYSSRRQRLDQAFLTARLTGARGYDRIAGYFSSSLLELAGEALESVTGKIRVICNSDLHPLDVQTARAAKNGLWKSWASSQPEALLDGAQPSKRFWRGANSAVNQPAPAGGFHQDPACANFVRAT